MVTIKKVLQGGLFFLSITLHGVEVSHVEAETGQMFPEIIETAIKVENLKKTIAAAYKEITLLYHTIGKHMLEFEAKRQWSASKVLSLVTNGLQLRFPELKGFNTRNIQYMRIFAKQYQDEAFVEEIVGQLSWAHIETILGRVREKDNQIFYMKKAVEDKWSRATLVKNIKLALHKEKIPASEATQALSNEQ
jgi:predicted nuclease of restriction endonuclease-like (RecB) superfamily